MTLSPWIRGTALLLAIGATGAAWAQASDDCKNHYILGNDGNGKCAVTSTPDAPTDVPSLRITQIYSSMDGSTQFIELTEYAGRDNQDHVAGLTLTSTSGGVTRTFVFPYDLPSSQTAHATFVIGVARDRDGQASGRIYEDGGCCVAYRDVDFEMPARFLAVEGGTVAFGGDVWNYPALPVESAQALYRDGSIGPPIVEGGQEHCPLPTGDLCGGSDIRVSAPMIGAVEFRDVFNDQRYVTADAVAIDTIDRGLSPGWVRSGLELGVGQRVATYLGVAYTYAGSPICRVRIPTSNGGGYYYSAKEDECRAAASEPGAVLEASAAFYAQSAGWTSGICAPLWSDFNDDLPLTPVYRVSSPLSPFDTRLTTDVKARDALVAAGWKRSGYGPEGVAMCVYN
jgi:hypothetical protein